jgi:predicted permease
MGFVSLLAVALMPVVEVFLVALLGAYLASGRCNLLTASARADINRVVYAVFTPALMLASLARTVTLQDAISWSPQFLVVLPFPIVYRFVSDHACTIDNPTPTG